MKGLFEIAVLQEIEDYLVQRGLGLIRDNFDLICGTSTGGIIALAVGACGFSLQKCRDLYTTLGSSIFSHPGWGFTGKGRYDATKFEDLLKYHFGDATLDPKQNIANPKVFVISAEAEAHLLKPYVFRNYEYQPVSDSLQQLSIRLHEGYRSSSALLVWEAARATSAAPTYFNSYQKNIEGRNLLLVDGGLLYNNPTFLAIHEAKKIWPNRVPELIISIGCGKEPDIPSNTNRNVLKWAKTAVDLITNSETINNEVLIHLFNMDYKGYYKRFDPTPIPDQVKLDSTDARLLSVCEKSVIDYIKKGEQQSSIYNAVSIISKTKNISL